MSEIATISPEQHTQPIEKTAALEVFSGVYKSFADEAISDAKEHKEKNKTWETDPTWIEVQKMDPAKTLVLETDPALIFLKDRFEFAKKDFKPLDGNPITALSIHDSFMERAKAKAKEDYDGKPLKLAEQIESADKVVSSFVDRATDMVIQGETDGLTVKIFFNKCNNFKTFSGRSYNNLVAKKDEPVPSKAICADYERVIKSTISDKKDLWDQDGGGFWHVNSNRHRASGSEITERFYISPKLNEKPGEVVKVWDKTLKDLGLDEKLYYKVAEGVADSRYEAVVAYSTPETANDTERAVQEFIKRCPPELLSDSAMPSGIEVAKGISRAPEPSELNALVESMGYERMSYNEFVVAVTELALRRASYEFVKSGYRIHNIMPRDLVEAAKPFFVQFVKLSGIDPKTMKVPRPLEYLGGPRQTRRPTHQHQNG